MKICPFCQTKLSDTCVFCSECGLQVPSSTEQSPLCPNCNQPVNANEPFCHNCGARISQSPVFTNNSDPVLTQSATDNETNFVYQQKSDENIPQPAKSKQKKGGLAKKLIFIGGGALLAVIAVVLVIFTFSGSGYKDAEFILYSKDNDNMYLAHSSKDETMKVTRDSGGNLAYLLADGESLVYYDGDEAYLRNINDQNQAPINVGDIDKSNEDMTILFSHEDGKVFMFDTTEKNPSKQLIARNVDNYFLSSDGENMAYINDEGTLFTKQTDEENSNRIASDVAGVIYIDTDFKIIYYIVDTSGNDDESVYTLYKSKNGKPGTAIDYDITSIEKIYESGEIYYTKESYYYDDWYNNYDLYYFDGKDTHTRIAEGIDSSQNASDEHTAVMYYEYMEDYERLDYYIALKDKTYKIGNNYVSSLEFSDDYLYYTERYSSESNSRTLYKVDISGKKLGKTQNLADGVYRYTLNDDGTYIYLADYNENRKTASLYYNDELVTDVLSYDEEYDYFYSLFQYYEDSETLLYKTDKNSDGEYTLNIYSGRKNTSVDYDVCSYEYFEDQDILIYYTNQDTLNVYSGNKKNTISSDVCKYIYDEDSDVYYYGVDKNDNEFTLMMYDGKKPQFIADGVTNFTISEDGMLFYISDYSYSKNTGTLYKYKNNEPIYVDSDVSRFNRITNVGKYMEEYKEELEQEYNTPYEDYL